jgi:hypothetical protein
MRLWTLMTNDQIQGHHGDNATGKNGLYENDICLSKKA